METDEQTYIVIGFAEFVQTFLLNFKFKADPT